MASTEHVLDNTPPSDVGLMTDKNGFSSSNDGVASYPETTDVIYRVEYTHKQGLKKFKALEPFELSESLDIIDTKSKSWPILEIITPVTALEGTFEEIMLERADGEKQPVIEECDSAALKDLPIRRIESSRMIIHSLHLVKAIRSIIRYYPRHTIHEGERIAFVEPYVPLLHHLDEIRGIHDELNGSSKANTQHGETVDDIKLCHALDVLLEALKSPIELCWQPVQTMLAKQKPVIDFGSLWAVFKPGQEVYFKDNSLGVHAEKPVAGMVIRTEYEYLPDHDGERKGTYQMQQENRQKGKGSSSRNLLSDPSGYAGANAIRVHIFNLQDSSVRNKCIIRRVEYRPIISYFDGVKDITELDICPCTFWDRLEGPSRRQAIINEGKEKVKILKQRCPLMEYTGSVLNIRPTFLNKEPFLADPQSAQLYYNEERDADFKNFWSERDRDFNPHRELGSTPCDNADQSCPERGTIELDENSELTDRQDLLLTPWVCGLVLKDKLWRIVHVSGLQQHTPNREALDRLILDESHKRLIQAACDEDDLTYNVDDVENKGSGKIILLHGPPGTGKTFTVESFAQACGRPLIYLTVADIGLKEDSIEANLERWFKLAETWRAFLLIDEADVFMERRQLADLTRNSLVAVFLRRVEYFCGLLFLTTNRPGHIDDAFTSRIAICIKYTPLTDESRTEMWDGLSEKLQRDMNKQNKEQNKHKAPHHIRIDYSAINYVKNDNAVKELKWNGREIRNALSTAISLARYNAVKSGVDVHKEGFSVSMNDFKSVVKMSAEFKTYMRLIDNMSEEERASQRRDRPVEDLLQAGHIAQR